MFIDEPTYAKIRRQMPIPCVDLLITDGGGRVLLVKRTSPPARGSWWFPGGRVHVQESRRHAAVRKLREECGLAARSVRELETKDLFLPLRGRGRRSHAITTLFLVTVRGARVTLDGQSADWSWRSTGQWLARVRQPFVRSVLTKFRRGEYGQPS